MSLWEREKRRVWETRVNLRLSVLASKRSLIRARSFAYRALARRGHTRRELEEKLQRCGFETQTVLSVLQELEADHYLDDRAFALAWVQKMMGQRFLGPLALQRGLESKGIDREIIRDILEKLYSGTAELQLALKAMKRRLAKVKGGKAKVLERNMAGYLGRRGFTSETIEKLIKRQNDIS
jgi:regulatory protein